MNIVILLIVLLVIFSVIGAPGIGVFNHSYGYWPSGIGGVLILILLVLLLTGGI